MTALAVHSIRFASPRGGGALPLRDPATDRLICLRPEWIRNERSTPAAFVRGTTADFAVVFSRGARRRMTRDGVWRIGAVGSGGYNVAERAVRLRFDGHGHSQAATFRLARALPDAIAVTPVTWRWYAVNAAGRRVNIGVSRHLLCTTWREPGNPAAWQTLPAPRDPRAWRGAAQRWVYLPLIEWTCRWAAGRRNEKTICDAIIANFSRSRLQYARPFHSVRGVLRGGGGYCGGFYLLFQALAGAQGVAVERRSMLVDWRPLRGERAMWCAIVVRSPGVNRTTPAEGASAFHDVDGPLGHARRVRHVRQRRYRFWGAPGAHHDGHCLNFLAYRGRWYLYDLSFFERAVGLDWTTLPPINLSRSLAVSRLGNFQAAYLDRAVGFMLGSLRVAGKLYRTTVDLVATVPGGPPAARTDNGVSAATHAIRDGGRRITFYWGP